MPWTTPLTITGGQTAGVSTAFNSHATDLAILTGAWTSYTPVWTASGTNPNIVTNGGTITGGWKLLGEKTTIFRISLVMGSSSGLGTGGYQFSLPSTANYGAHMPCGVGNLWDASAGTDSTRVAILPGTVTCALNDATSRVNDSTIAWAAGDQINILGVYEAN